MAQLAHLYRRVSHPSQLSGHGLKRQDENTLAFVKSRGLVLIGTYEDRGISAWKGKNQKHGELGRVLELIRAGIIKPGEGLVVDALDRLSRQPFMSAFALLQEILQSGIVIHAIHEPNPITLESVNAVPQIAQSVISALMLAHDESRNKSRLVRQAYQHGRDVGEIVAGRVPTWVVRHHNRKTGKKWFTLDEEIVPVVKRIFEMCASGHSSYEIAKRFSEEGIKPFGGGKRLAGSAATNKHHWNSTTIQDIVRSRAVLGEFRSHQVWEDENGKRQNKLMKVMPDYYPSGFIEHELWQKANDALVLRKRARVRGNTGIGFPNLLKPIAVCQHCGSTMQIKNQIAKKDGSKFRRLRCAGRSENYCDNSRVPRYDQVEEAILRLVSEIKLTDHRSAEKSALTRVVNEESMKLDALQVEVRNIILSFKGSPTAVAIVAEKEAEIATLAKSRSENQAKLDALNFSQSPESRRDAMIELIGRMRSEIDLQKLHDIRTELNMRLRQAIKHVVFDCNGDIAIHLHGETAWYLLAQDKGGLTSGMRLIDRPALSEQMRDLRGHKVDDFVMIKTERAVRPPAG